jgi:hypothetical protein
LTPTKKPLLINGKKITVQSLNDEIMNNSTSLNPEFFAEKFELNDDL